MDKDQTIMRTDGQYPVLLMPKRCMSLEVEYDDSTNIYTNLNISSVDTGGNNFDIYSGWCNMKLVDSYNVNFQPSQLTVCGFNMSNCDEITCRTSQTWMNTEPAQENFIDSTSIVYKSHTYVSTELTSTYKHKKFQNSYRNQQLRSYDHSDELECGIILSKLHDNILNENIIRERDERRFVETYSQGDALQQLMSGDIQSVSKRNKLVLYVGPNDGNDGITNKNSGPVLTSVGHDINNKTYGTCNQNTEPIKCTNCDEIFTDPLFYEEHSANSICWTQPTTTINTTCFICHECGKTLKTFEKLKQHSQYHGNPDHECSLCKKVLATKFSLKQHMKIHNRNFKCSSCLKMFFQKQELATHMSSLHKIFICTDCDYTTINYDDFRVHISSHSEANELYADEQLPVENEGIIEEESDLILPPTDVSEPNEKGVDESKGLIEKVISNNVFFMSTKQAKEHSQESKKCHVCWKMFKRIGELKIHLIEHVVTCTMLQSPVSPNGELELRCQVCQKECFNKVDKYKAHLRAHAKLTIYQCIICDKYFSNSSNYCKHKKKHGLSSYVCDICGRKFNTKRSIISHMIYHMKNKPVNCNLCSQIFYYPSELKRHMRYSHTKILGNSFRCKFCKEHFMSLKKLWDHEWSKHNARKSVVDCLVCDSKFRKYSELRKHCCVVHGFNIPKL